MMKFTNPEDLVDTAERMPIQGWYALTTAEEYIGVLKSTDLGWIIGTTDVDRITYPILLSRVPR